MDINQPPRFVISLAWIYHGLFPKLLRVAPVEQEMTASFGFSEAVSYWITKGAGVGEVLFGIAFFFLYKERWINYMNIAALSGLLAFVALFNTHLLVGAFNPVTTNLPLIALSLVLLNNNLSKYIRKNEIS